MGDGKALQMGTSHELGQNFAKAFDIDYLDDAGQRQLCWTTSWGTSTRMLGGLIMCHGDDGGLRVPPRLAHVQVVVLLVRDEDGAGETAQRLVDELLAAGVRARLDAHTAASFGRRATDWELKGVPVRVEVGPRDLKAGQVTLVRRDDGSKVAVAVETTAAAVADALQAAQANLLALATARRDERTETVATVEEAAEVAQRGFARIRWSALGEEGESALAAKAITVRCLQHPDGSVPSELTEDVEAVVARAY